MVLFKIPTKSNVASLRINGCMMKNTLFSKIVLILFLTLFQLKPAFADSFRCNNKVVKTGDTTIEVKLKCGTPFDIEYIGKTKIRNKRVNVDRYTYVPEKGKLIKFLEFHNGKLVKVSNGPRVQ